MGDNLEVMPPLQVGLVLGEIAEEAVAVAAHRSSPHPRRRRRHPKKEVQSGPGLKFASGRAECLAAREMTRPNLNGAQRVALQVSLPALVHQDPTS